MAGYLPTWATVAEAEKWLTDESGEPWPLPRLIEAGCRVYAWMDPPPPGTTPMRDTWIARVFEGRSEGFLAEFVFGSDTARIQIDRSAALSMTRTPSGTLVRFDPPIPVDLASLRFARADLQALVSASPSQSGPKVKRADLIERNKSQWPAIERDLRELSRGSQWLAPAKAGGGFWFEGTALRLARANGRIEAAAEGGASVAWLAPPARGKK